MMRGQGRALSLQLFCQPAQVDQSQTLLLVLQCGAQTRFSVVLRNKFSLLHPGPSGSQLGTAGMGYYHADPPPQPCHTLLLGFWAVVWCLGAAAPCLSYGTAVRRIQSLKTRQLVLIEIPGSGKTSSLLGEGKRRGLGWGECQGNGSALGLVMVLKVTGGFGTARVHPPFARSLHRFCRSRSGQVHSDRPNIYGWVGICFQSPGAARGSQCRRG